MSSKTPNSKLVPPRADVWNREETFRRFVESSQELVTVVDEDGRFLYVNPAAEAVFDLPTASCVGRLAWDFIHPDDLQATREAFEAWLADHAKTSFDFENRQVSAAGAVRHMLWTVTRQDQQGDRPTCITSIGRDITQIRAFEQELHKSEAMQRSVLEGLLDPLVTIDGRGKILSANESCQAVLGFTRAELVGQNINLMMPEPFRSEHNSYLKRYQETGNTWILGRTREFEVLRKDGTRIVVDLSVSRIDAPGSEEPVFSGSFRDITARKLAERMLGESERRFRAIFDREFEFVGLLDPDGILLEANRTVLEIAGVEREDVIGRPFWEAPWWKQSTHTQDEVSEAIQRGAEGEFVRFETEHLGADGEIFLIDFSITPILDEAGRVVLLIPEGRDITDIKRAQQRETAMMRAFAEIGESASLLAHEIKNPITSVNLALRAVSKHLGEDEQEVLQDLVERMQKLEKLMRRTLSLARPIDIRPIPCDAGQVIATAARMMAPHCEAAEIEMIQEAEESVIALADPQLVEDVLTNLIRNALEAIGSKGRIRMSARKAGSKILLRVEDDGPGISESVLENLFKPFVTTKAAGTGLGLPIVRKVVEAHGGTIEVRASPLGGACFEVGLCSSQK